MRRIKGVRMGIYEALTQLLFVDDVLLLYFKSERDVVNFSRKFYNFTVRLHAWK